MKHVRVMRHWIALLLVTLLLGCATKVPAPRNADEAVWRGRLSVKVYSQPIQAFTADFELQGTPSTGELLLTSTLGTTLARMEWNNAGATLQAQGERKAFVSLQALARQVTGTDIPIGSLFAWLRGDAERADGWQVDLTNHAQGRITAKHPGEIQAELKIILDQ